MTVNLNNSEGLSRTLNSIRAQREIRPQLFVIDGGSTDTSQSVINSNLDLITEYQSGFDNGIYHAMNIGTSLARGCDFLLYLNSGDVFASPTVLLMIALFLNGLDFWPAVLYGDSLLITSSEDSDPRLSKAKSLDFLRYNLHAHHQSIFFYRPSLGDEPYNYKSYPRCADFELVLRLKLRGEHFVYLPLPISTFLEGGRSYDLSFQKEGYKEHCRIQSSLSNGYLASLLAGIYLLRFRILNALRRFLRSNYSFAFYAYFGFFNFFANAIQKFFKLFLTVYRYPRLAILNCWVGVEHLSMLDTLPVITSFVDVGANRGQFLMATALRYASYLYYAFDPLPLTSRIIQVLRHSLRSSIKVIDKKILISDRVKLVPFFTTLSDDCSSYLAPSPASLYPSRTAVAQTTYITSTTLDSLFAEAPLTRPSLLKIDTQGAELDVLKGSRNILLSQVFDYLYVEVSDCEHYTGQPSFLDICLYLRSYNYFPYKFFNVNLSRSGLLVYADILFVPKN